MGFTNRAPQASFPTMTIDTRCSDDCRERQCSSNGSRRVNPALHAGVRRYALARNSMRSREAISMSYIFWNAWKALLRYRS